MKTIADALVVDPFSGEPFWTLPDYRRETLMARRAEVEVPLRLSLAVRDFLKITMVPSDRLTILDVSHALRVLGATAGRNGAMVLEEADHAWLVERIESQGLSVFGLHAQQVVDLLRSGVKTT